MKKLVLAVLALTSMSALKAQYPLVEIYDVQYRDEAALATEDDLSLYEGDTIRIQGVVTFDPCDYGLSSTGSRMGTWLQDIDGGPFSGVHVLIDYPAIDYPDLESLNEATLFVDNFQVGNIVECTGIVSTFEGNTQFWLIPVESEIIGFSTLPTPDPAVIEDMMVSDGAGGQVINTIDGEQFEGRYVELTNVFVTDVVPSGLRWFWYLQDAAGNKIQIRDVSGHFRNDTYDDECNIWAGGAAGETNTPDIYTPPAIGTNLAYVRGVILEFTAETQYAITPLTLGDIGPALASPPVITDITRSPVVATPDDAVTITANITDLDGTVASANVYFSYGYGSTDWNANPMTSIGGDLWSGEIPATGFDSMYVNYYIEAYDNAGNVINTPAPTSPLTYIVYADGINTLVQIQNTPYSNGASVWANDSIPEMNIEAYVTASTQTYDLGLVAVQENNNPYSGIFIKSVPGDGTDALLRGDKIRITAGKVIEEFGVTKLTNITFTLLSTMNDLPDFISGINPMDVDAKLYAATEPYEGMLVKFDNMFVTSQNADGVAGDFGEWRVNATNTPEMGMRCDDYSYGINFEFAADSLTLGEELGYIQGLMYYSFSNWKLLPRDKNDIEGYATTYPNSIVSFNFTTPAATGVIDQEAGTILLTVPMGTDLTSLVPTIDYTGQYVDPASGVSENFSAPVTYTCYSPVNYAPKAYVVTVQTAVSATLSEALKTGVYPVPATDDLTVEIDMPSASEVTLQIVDLEGRKWLEINELCVVGKNIFRFDLRGLSNGLYLLQLSSSTETSTRKIEVSR